VNRIWIDGLAIHTGIMRFRIIIPSFTLLALVLSAGCTSTVPPPELTGSSWVLVSYLDQESNLVPIPPGIQASVTFRNDGQVLGNSGCNDFSATYQVDGGLMTIENIVSTEKGCPSPKGVMDFEQQFLSLLSDTTRYNIDENGLTLSHYDERKLMVFRKA
jgi:heat shock protein HslJ